MFLMPHHLGCNKDFWFVYMGFRRIQFQLGMQDVVADNFVSSRC